MPREILAWLAVVAGCIFLLPQQFYPALAGGCFLFYLFLKSKD